MSDIPKTRQQLEKFAAALADAGGRAWAGKEEDQETMKKALAILARDFSVGPGSDLDRLIDRSYHSYRVGAQEFAGFTVAELDKLMEGDLPLRDQEILYEFRQVIQREVQRRYPGFDLEAQARRHT